MWIDRFSRSLLMMTLTFVAYSANRPAVVEATPLSTETPLQTPTMIPTIIPEVSSTPEIITNKKVQFNGNQFDIAQQPKYESGYVSSDPNTLTEFRMAGRMGNVGLLAHNDLAGENFFDIELHDEIILTKEDQNSEKFAVTQILEFETLPDGMYRDLKTNEILDITELFTLVYAGDYHMTLQTCLAKEDNLNWGLLYIIAYPTSFQENLSPID